MYRRLAARLQNTRMNWWEACEDLGLDYNQVDPEQIPLEQCAHCDIWGSNLIADLDFNPICYYCRDLAGM